LLEPNIGGNGMRKEYSDYEEDEALIQLSTEELQKFIRVAEAYLKYANNTEVELAFTSNVGSLLENIKKIRYSYYDSFLEKLGEVLRILEEIQSQTKDDNIKALVEEAINQIKDFYSRFGLKYQEYYPKGYYGYGYGKYKYSYPYSKEDKKQLVDQLSQEVLQEEVMKLKEKEDADLKQRLRDNLLFDMIAESHPFGGKEYTYREELKRQADWEDIDKRLMDVAQSIRQEQQELEQAKKELASLQNKEVELSATEEQLKTVREKLLQKAIDYILSCGTQQ
jgi:hypothetical protein